LPHDRLSEADQREIELKIKDFEVLFRRQQELGVIGTDQQIEAELRKLADSQGALA